ncbi:MAG: iron-containing alcohol dehydrogenase, partial [Gammaproteobacteria bacterium]|nr:iron-containing alcohol dehydrogenase [Gammaproteobacteria bacterium]
MLNYAYRGLPWDIVFGVDAARRLPDEMDQRGLERALVLTTPNQARQGEQLKQQLAHRAVGLFSEAVMHVPSGTLAAATHLAKAVDARCTVALGGGSTTGLGKALAVKNGLANVAIPTTYAGSEMTDIWAVTEGDRKVTKRDVRAVPTLTIYDPKLTLSL